MATLSQLYNAYLQDDPNVGEMTYDPFGWNIPQTFADPTTTSPGDGDVPDDGGEATNAMGVPINKIRFPTGSFDRTDIPNVTDTGEKFSDLPITDPRYMSEAEQIFQQNRADAGAYAWDSPQYIGGARGNITQTGPGREWTDDEQILFGDMSEYGGPEEDASWFKQLREGLSDNPLLQGVMAIASPFTTIAKGFAQALPVNKRAIAEKQGLQQGFAIDDIGRVAYQDVGYVDGKHQALGRDDPRNIFAGLNYNLIDQNTIDKMKARINKGLMKTNPELAKKRKAIIDQAWIIKQLGDETTKEIVDRKEYKKREKKREKIQEDLAAAGFGASGAVGIDKDMDIDTKDISDAGTYVPPSKPKVTAKHSPHQHHHDDNNGGGGGGGGGGGAGDDWGDMSYMIAEGGLAQHAPRGRYFNGGLIRRPYAKGGIVDLL
jgi:hypothetical protein